MLVSSSSHHLTAYRALYKQNLNLYVRHEALSSSKAWMKRHVNDAYVKQATNESLRSRSSYKLQEIQEKYKIIFPSSFVLDLGASPGGWSLIAAKALHFQPSSSSSTSLAGCIVAVDLLPMDPIQHVHIIQGDFTTSLIQEQIKAYCSRPPDVVLSDMLGNSTGHHEVDHYRSMDLCQQALMFCEAMIHPAGSFLCKYLRGSDEKAFIDSMKQRFRQVDVLKPKASRSESSEMYVLARKLK